MNILAIIPARSGSKGIVDKNIRLCNGKPLIAYSIEQAKQSSYINRIIVSTDSAEYAKIAKSFGAEVPFLRPAEISGDSSLDIELFEHMLKYLSDNEGYTPDILVHLRPTHPVRSVSDIDAMVKILCDNPEYDSVRSVTPTEHTPFKMWTMNESGKLAPVAACGIPEAYNAPRQSLPNTYLHNGCIDIIRPSVILEKYSMSGTAIYGYEQDFSIDIDTESDFIKAAAHLETYAKLRSGLPLKFCFDIDGVIAQKNISLDYSKAMPNRPVIALVNLAYDNKHQILLYTARGYESGIDWRETTETQLKSWGVKYHKLLFGKPAADVYIDDKFYDISQLEILLRG